MSSSINYAALDAEDNDRGNEEHQEAVAPDAAPAPARRRPSRRALTEDERLERALAQVETLQQRVVAKREERRSRLVEDLYALHGVSGEPDDLSEARRIAELRERLGL